MQLRRHKDIIAVKHNAESTAVAFHARNLEVAQVSEEAWNSMAPTTFNNGFVMNLESNELGVTADALQSLEDWNLEENPDIEPGKLAFGIRSLTINVTQICNLHCTYCAAGGDGTYGDATARITVEKTFPQLRFFMEKLKAGDTFRITFLGGEPLLYPEGIQLLAQYVNSLAKEKSVVTAYNVITNATLIDDKNLAILANIKSAVTVSIDGAPEAHDRVRPQKNGQGSSKAVVEGLKKIIAQKKELGHIRLHAVISRQNLEVLNSYLFLSEFGADSYEFTFDVTDADPAANRKFLLEMTKVAEIAFSRGGEAELRKIILFDGYFSALDEQRRTENHCGSGKSLLSIDSNNKIYACPLDVGHKEAQVGYGTELSLEALSPLQEPFIEKNKCTDCWARFLCGGGCLFVHKSLTGDKNQKHFSFCERTRYLVSLSLLYYEKCRN